MNAAATRLQSRGTIAEGYAYARRVDPFAVIVLGALGGLVLAVALLGLLSPAAPPEARDGGPAVPTEGDDLEQLLEAANRGRRRRGQAELTAAGLRADVDAELRAAAPGRRGRAGDPR
jgi:hypothetical protein